MEETIVWRRVEESLPPDSDEVLVKLGYRVCLGFYLAEKKAWLVDREPFIAQVWAWAMKPGGPPVQKLAHPKSDRSENPGNYGAATRI